jgi:GTP-binding protein
LFSALKKQGVDDVAQLLWNWTHPETPELVATDAFSVSDTAPLEAVINVNPV